ncbi:hypothetical protein BSPA111_41890 [Buttiauxella sp. A111]|nr:hypothetical protein BSPA111_41890 [Buttiauxella sp. A111]
MLFLDKPSRLSSETSYFENYSAMCIAKDLFIEGVFGKGIRVCSA